MAREEMSAEDIITPMCKDYQHVTFIIIKDTP